MKKLFQSHHPVRHFNSFKHALNGIKHAIFNEANFRVQLIIAILSTALGIHFKISYLEWALIVLSMGFLLCAEIINTAIEEFIDHLIHEHHEGAKVIKDLAAGFVLTASFTAFIVSLLIFLDDILVVISKMI